MHPPQAAVQINGAFVALALVQHGDGRSMLLGSDDDIKITVRAQARLRVKPRYRPAFDQDRFHSGRAQGSEKLSQHLLMHGSANGVQTIRLLQGVGCGGCLESAVTDTMPAESSAPRSQQQWGDLS